jgi:phosphate-selective porin OprO/OprP
VRAMKATWVSLIAALTALAPCASALAQQPNAGAAPATGLAAVIQEIAPDESPALAQPRPVARAPESTSILGAPAPGQARPIPAYIVPAPSGYPDTGIEAHPLVATNAVTPIGTSTVADLARRLEATERELAELRKQPVFSRLTGTAKETGSSILPVAQVQEGPGPAADVDTEARIQALEEAAAASKKAYPLIRLSGFFQVDDGLFSQDANSRATLGDIQDGIGFRRARLQALGNVAEFTRYSVEFDFAIAGRPSFLDVWGEQGNIPFFGNIRIGHFRQPTTMDALTSIRHLEFLERNADFQALDPFRRTGIMAWRVAEDELGTIAYSAYATGTTFFNGATTTYQTLGDTRFATQIGDQGGISTAIRGTRLLYYDEPAEGRYLLHVGAGYNFSEIGGTGTTGTGARAYESRSIPEFFVGDATGGGLTVAGTPFVVDTGRILANNYHFAHTELAANMGSAHFQTEFLATSLNQMGGPAIFYYGAYAQAGFFLTGESCGYNKLTGVLDYNVKPFTEFFGLGAKKRMCGWGAWEIAARWTYLNVSAAPNPANVLVGVPGPPPVPNPGVLNESTVALNWWWNQYTRVQFNWIHSMLDNNARGFSAMDIFATRFQVEF